VVSNVRLLREGLVRSLRRRRPTEVAVVGCAPFSEAETGVIPDLRPDVILVDVAHLDGMGAARTLRSLSPASKLIAFSIADSEEVVLSCAAAGYSGYVTQEATVDDLLHAVRDVRNGRMTCSARVAAAMYSKLSAMLNGPDSADDGSPLTVRDRQVLMLLDEGWSNKEIARRLQISPATVKNHVHSTLQKLGVARRGQASAWVRRANARTDS
jgi:DNA-binding NarL/FixJ family response regulator